VLQERLGQASLDKTLRTYSRLMPASEQRTRSVAESAWAALVYPTCTDEAL